MVGLGWVRRKEEGEEEKEAVAEEEEEEDWAALQTMTMMESAQWAKTTMATGQRATKSTMMATVGRATMSTTMVTAQRATGCDDEDDGD